MEFIVRGYLRIDGKHYLKISYCSLSDSKYHQVSMTILSILVDLENAIVWMLSSRSPISNFFSAFSKTL